MAVDLLIDGSVTAIICAIDRRTQGLTPPELGESSGEIPVVEFNLPEPNVENLLTHAFRRISIRLVAQQFRNHAFVVNGLSST